MPDVASSSRVSCSVNRRSPARISETSSASLSRCSLIGGSRRDDNTRRAGLGKIASRCSSCARASADFSSWRSSMISTTGSACSAISDATPSTSWSPGSTGRSGLIAPRTELQNRSACCSSRSTATNATRRGVVEWSAHARSSEVLPLPAGAEMTVTRLPTARSSIWRRSSRSSRRRATDELAMLTPPSAPAIGSARGQTKAELPAACWSMASPPPRGASQPSGEHVTFPLAGPPFIAATATLRLPASATIGVAASWNTAAPPRSGPGDFPASGNARASERWDASTVSRRCLIVDDNAGYLSEASDLLQRQGMSVVGVASTSGDALAIAASDRLDVALVDVDLGAESGLDVARALAMSDEPVPVILISAYAEKDLRELLDDSPAVGFLPKSVLSRAAIDGLLGDREERCGT